LIALLYIVPKNIYIYGDNPGTNRGHRKSGYALARHTTRKYATGRTSHGFLFLDMALISLMVAPLRFAWRWMQAAAACKGRRDLLELSAVGFSCEPCRTPISTRTEIAVPDACADVWTVSNGLNGELLSSALGGAARWRW
jgi:hypothetical protein